MSGLVIVETVPEQLVMRLTSNHIRIAQNIKIV